MIPQDLSSRIFFQEQLYSQREIKGSETVVYNMIIDNWLYINDSISIVLFFEYKYLYLMWSIAYKSSSKIFKYE